MTKPIIDQLDGMAEGARQRAERHRGEEAAARQRGDAGTAEQHRAAKQHEEGQQDLASAAAKRAREGGEA